MLVNETNVLYLQTEGGKCNTADNIIGMKKAFGRDIYMVIDLGDKNLGDDLDDCVKISCSNKRALSLATGIRYYRLVYVFKRQKRSYLVENGKLILKSEVYYKGSQPGGFRVKAVRTNY